MSLEGRTICLVEDDPIMGESLVQRLSLEGARVEWIRTGGDAERAIAAASPDLVVCDIRLPDRHGGEVFRAVAEGGAPPPFLFITAHGDIEDAVALMRAGAADYLTKPFAMDAFLARIADLVRMHPVRRTRSFLGVSPAMRELEAMLHRVAATRVTTLIQGETGTGKEVVARFLHGLTDRADSPFVAVNCAAIPEQLLESEIFGHERGAFTGAEKRHLGYAERAGEGTLFLDEIADLSLPLQAKLLRLLENRTFRRVGGDEERPFRARVVAATHADLESRLKEGAFREDLFYRLAVVTVSLPPLRERREDIPWLLDRFFVSATSAAGSPLKHVSPAASQAALAHDWPGNAREMRNRMDRAVALAQGESLMPGDLFPVLASQAASPQAASLAQIRGGAERRRIEDALRDTGGRIGEAAKSLGVSRTTMWEKMKKLGMGNAAQE